MLVVQWLAGRELGESSESRQDTGCSWRVGGAPSPPGYGSIHDLPEIGKGAGDNWPATQYSSGTSPPSALETPPSDDPLVFVFPPPSFFLLLHLFLKYSSSLLLSITFVLQFTSHSLPAA